MLKCLFACSLSFGVVLAPAWAQDTQQSADKLGKKGIYGTSSVGAEDGGPTSTTTTTTTTSSGTTTTTTTNQQQNPNKPKYPLSTTSRTTTNQRAQQFLLKGMQLYHLTRDIFTAANEISSTFDEGNHAYSLKQQGVIKARLQPQDLLLYGPEHAHIAVRLRALQQAEATIVQAISNFRQAQGLAPRLSVLPKWIRVSQDTQKALRFHIQFYQKALRAVQGGTVLSELQLERMAQMWSAPRALKPTDTLTTHVQTYYFEQARARRLGKPADDEKATESASLDGYQTNLPSLDFEIKGN